MWVFALSGLRCEGGSQAGVGFGVEREEGGETVQPAAWQGARPLSHKQPIGTGVFFSLMSSAVMSAAQRRSSAHRQERAALIKAHRVTDRQATADAGKGLCRHHPHTQRSGGSFRFSPLYFNSADTDSRASWEPESAGWECSEYITYILFFLHIAILCPISILE